jgi:hypothetical protein
MLPLRTLLDIDLARLLSRSEGKTRNLEYINLDFAAGEIAVLAVLEALL